MLAPLPQSLPPDSIRGEGPSNFGTRKLQIELRNASNCCFCASGRFT